MTCQVTRILQIKPYRENGYPEAPVLDILDSQVSLRGVRQRNSVLERNCAIMTGDEQEFRLLKLTSDIKKRKDNQATFQLFPIA